MKPSLRQKVTGHGGRSRRPDTMKPVLQREPTGCGIASVATLARVTYKHAQHAADQFGISTKDDRLEYRLRPHAASPLRHSCVQSRTAFSFLENVAGSRAFGDQMARAAWSGFLALGGVLARTAWCRCAPSKAGASHTSTYGFWSHEAEVAYRNFRYDITPRQITHTGEDDTLLA